MGINNCNQVTQNIPKQYIQNNSTDIDHVGMIDHVGHVDKGEIPTREQLIMALCILSAIYPSS